MSTVGDWIQTCYVTLFWSLLFSYRKWRHAWLLSLKQIALTPNDVSGAHQQVAPWTAGFVVSPMRPVPVMLHIQKGTGSLRNYRYIQPFLDAFFFSSSIEAFRPLNALSSINVLWFDAGRADTGGDNMADWELLPSPHWRLVLLWKVLYRWLLHCLERKYPYRQSINISIHGVSAQQQCNSGVST